MRKNMYVCTIQHCTANFTLTVDMKNGNSANHHVAAETDNILRMPDGLEGGREQWWRLDCWIHSDLYYPHDQHLPQ